MFQIYFIHGLFFFRLSINSIKTPVDHASYVTIVEQSLARFFKRHGQDIFFYADKIIQQRTSNPAVYQTKKYY